MRAASCTAGTGKSGEVVGFLLWPHAGWGYPAAQGSKYYKAIKKGKEKIKRKKEEKNLPSANAVV